MDLRESQVAMAAALFDVTNLAPALPLFKGDPRAVAQRLAQYRGTRGESRKGAGGSVPGLANTGRAGIFCGIKRCLRQRASIDLGRPESLR